MRKKITTFLQYHNLIKLRNFQKCRNSIISKTQLRHFRATTCSWEEEKNAKTPVVKETSTKVMTREEEQKIIQRIKEGDRFYPFDSPGEKVVFHMKQELNLLARQALYYILGLKIGDLNPEYFPREADILIVGGGPTGILIAHAIKNCMPHGPNVVVVDKNETFLPPTLNLSQGMMIQQLFTDKEEVLMAQYCAEFIGSFSRVMEVMGQPLFHTGYEPLGSLVLADEYNADELLNKSDYLETLGVFNRILDDKTLKRKFPWLNTKGALFGVLGMAHEGLLNPWVFLNAVKLKAYNLGVKFVTGEVIEISEGGDIARRVICKLPNGTLDYITFGRMVVATGIESLQFSNIINKYIFEDKGDLVLNMPLELRRKYEYCLYNPDGPGLDTPILLDLNGRYFRREGLCGHYVAGISGIPCNEEEENNASNVFANKVKPFLSERIPNFDKFELQNCWVDDYIINTLNEVGLTGYHPDEPKIVFAVGFCGKFGFQYLPAVARGVMELILYGQYLNIDFSKYHVLNLWNVEEYYEAKRKRVEIIKSRLPLY